MKFIKHLIIIFFIGILFAFKSNRNSDFHFLDQNGNEFVIKENAMIPKIIDTTFLKNNINGEYFSNEEKEDSKIKYKYIFEKFIKINKLEYRINITQSPLSKRIEDILRFQGITNYKITFLKTKKGIKISSIKYMYSEI